jgi:UDP-N-acetylmuramate-alanine ligase
MQTKHYHKMSLSVDDIVVKFPTKTVPTISGEPGYASISSMVQLMYGNAALLPTTLGGGQLGHLGLIMTPILI